MTPAHDFGDMLLNAHSWYRIDTPLDYIRATLWCGSNLATSVAYFLIPNEIARWRKALPFAASALIGRLFVAFIFTCGLSHLAMLAIMQTGPWWAILLIYLPMAGVSVATVIVIRRDRDLIVAVLDTVSRALKDGGG
ncbi:MAG: hypothetical protein WDN03_06890 [Rhizomicrobium sp.]